MISPAAAKSSRIPVITIPVFDDYRLLILEWFDSIEAGAPRQVIPVIEAARRRLKRVKRSIRHEGLAEFLEQALLELRDNEVEGAQYILLTALAAFGWSTDGAQ